MNEPLSKRGGWGKDKLTGVSGTKSATTDIISLALTERRQGEDLGIFEVIDTNKKCNQQALIGCRLRLNTVH